MASSVSISVAVRFSSASRRGGVACSAASTEPSRGPASAGATAPNAPTAAARLNKSRREMNVMCCSQACATSAALLPFVCRHQLTLPDDVPFDCFEQFSAVEPRFQIQIRIEGEHDEAVVMRLAWRTRRATIDRTLESGDPLDRTLNLRRHPQVTLAAE